MGDWRIICVLCRLYCKTIGRKVKGIKDFVGHNMSEYFGDKEMKYYPDNFFITNFKKEYKSANLMWHLGVNLLPILLGPF